MQFWGIDDLCKLGKEYITALTCKYAFNSRQFWNFWRITRVSIITHCKVIWSITVRFFLAHPLYAGFVHLRILRHLYQCSPPISMLHVKRHKSPRSEWYLLCFDNLRIKFLFLYIFNSGSFDEPFVKPRITTVVTWLSEHTAITQGIHVIQCVVEHRHVGDVRQK